MTVWQVTASSTLGSISPSTARFSRTAAEASCCNSTLDITSTGPEGCSLFLRMRLGVSRKPALARGSKRARLACTIPKTVLATTQSSSLSTPSLSCPIP
eukprot:CAMPEP_0173202646 /NCGR_PEP_ID=MMETSP1141-20130122/19089_1 /TAXON_ID=483371 /ORGANISM="non described non described, Strain CCMP2298" /LENGTH=98 /DNA_ID=CAMNT_0014128035 /DNA_START=319 /DNA_END=615 /DNA_ORIENTATION=-